MAYADNLIGQIRFDESHKALGHVTLPIQMPLYAGIIAPPWTPSIPHHSLNPFAQYARQTDFR